MPVPWLRCHGFSLGVGVQHHQGLRLHHQGAVNQQTTDRIRKVFFQPQGFRFQDLHSQGDGGIGAGHNGSRVGRFHRSQVVAFIDLEAGRRPVEGEDVRIIYIKGMQF